ncbi:MAG: helix-turn-helix transcriptional regulator [Rhodoblastus sp.]
MKSEALTSFGAAVRARRKALNFSQEGLAAASNLDRTYIGGVERGERNVSLVNINKIAEALETSASALLREAGL